MEPYILTPNALQNLKSVSSIMPPKTRRRKRKTKGRRKVARQYKNYTFTKRLMPGFPKNTMVKMRYVDTITLNPGIATLANYQFRANGIYDPDITGAGHQPLGHDEFGLFYNHYCVVGSKITAKFTYGSAAASTAAQIGIYLSDDTSIPTNGNDICEQGLGKFDLMGALAYAPVAGRSKSNVPQITNTYSAKKFFNIKDIKDNVSRLGAAWNASPSDQAIYNVWVYPMDGSDLGVFNVLVTIDYIVMLSEPQTLQRS